MPYSLVLNLLPLSSIPVGYLSGRHLHALFLNLASSVDPALGTKLHQSQADKAFTLSPLQIHKTHLLWQHKQPVAAGTPCWWRISLLDDILFAKLTSLWLNLNPDRPWHLGPADLKITSIFGTPRKEQPWSNSCSYAQLYEAASSETTIFSFLLATPTAFRQGKNDSSLPTKELVFRSLLNRWNKYSQIEIVHFPLDALFPSFFDIHTEITTDSRSKFIGCVGEITYRILDDVESSVIKHLNVLADYAIYCGIGRKTPMGLGMAQRI